MSHPRESESGTCPRCGNPVPDGLLKPSPVSMEATVKYHRVCWDAEVVDIRSAIAKGEKAIAEGRVIDHAEAMQRLERFRVGSNHLE